MNRRYRLAAEVVVAAIFVIAAGVWWWWRAAPPAGPAGAPAGGNTFATSATRQAVPLGAVVPINPSATAPAGYAIPKAVGQSAPGSVIQLFNYSTIEITNNQFKPNTISVYTGDAVHVDFLAIDKNYDVTQPDNGLSLLLPKGQKKTLEFQTGPPGKFTFYCSRCGGPASGPIGYIVVVPR